jgi:hypothetical protein
MFVYCLNNPINTNDSSGYMAVSAFQQTREGIFKGAGAIASTTTAVVGTAFVLDLWEEFEKAINKSLAKAISTTKYRSPTEVHHIAAMQSYKAEEARLILEIVFPDGVENPANKVELKTKLHKRLHTNAYYALINAIVVAAYKSANGDKEKAEENVRAALASAKAFLIGLNESTS